MIVMHDFIIPRRARSVVTEVVALHVLVAGQKAGVVIDALA